MFLVSKKSILSQSKYGTLNRYIVLFLKFQLSNNPCGVNLCTHTHTHISTHARTRSHPHTQPHTHSQTHTQVSHIYIYTHTLTYKNIFVSTLNRSRLCHAKQTNCILYSLYKKYKLNLHADAKKPFYNIRNAVEKRKKYHEAEKQCHNPQDKIDKEIP